MVSQWQKDMNEISRIQFKTNLTQQEKNRLISKLEKKMAIKEQRELDGRNTGYFND